MDDSLIFGDGVHPDDESPLHLTIQCLLSSYLSTDSDTYLPSSVMRAYHEDMTYGEPEWMDTNPAEG